MRIISGTAKGRKLKSPSGNTRPLSDRVREALFNILQNRVAGSAFLDLFAGSGAVGIEALSRGASLAIFAELDRGNVRIIKENLAICAYADQAEVYALDVAQALKILKRKQAKFDIIFIGAPYDSPVLESALLDLSDCALLSENAVVVAEHRKQHPLQEAYGKLKRLREARYGETVLGFYTI